MKNFLVAVLALSLFSCGANNAKLAPIKKEIVPVTIDSNASVEKEHYDGRCNLDNEMSSLGIGLIIVPLKFVLYDDSLLKSEPKLVDMYEKYDSLSNVCSCVFDPEYGIMHFTCTGKTSKAYRVLINYSQVKYLPREKEYQFKTWEQYIENSYGIRRKTESDSARTPIGFVRKEPSDQADTISIPAGQEMFCPVQVKGDWVKVQYDCFYNQEHNPYEGQPCHTYINKCAIPLTGWLRWRQDNKQLIDIFLMP
jgi:hypothetical protein